MVNKPCSHFFPAKCSTLDRAFSEPLAIIAVLPAPTFANNPDSKPLEFEEIRNRGWL